VVGAVRDAERSDAALLRAARFGDTDAFGAIVERHGPGMRRYARFILGDEDDAADATQEALVSAWRGLGTFRGESSLRTWLFTLVSRRAADLQRRRRPVPVEEQQLEQRLPAAPDTASGTAVEAELLEALRSALQELPWRQRACWLLRELEGLSYDEIAATVGVTSGQVRGYLQRGRATLAERMEPWR
jgi:RNA polymerase sigma-70 factor, ECF subfamily